MTWSIRRRLSASRARRRGEESGYVAPFVAVLCFVLFGLAAFTVDVGNWYLTGQQVQRSADAAALAGVIRLPGDPDAADALAADLAEINGEPGDVVVSEVDGLPTRLRVTVTRTVDNVFGTLLGEPTTTITRTAVADYAGPVAMGNPCNTFGDDPEPGNTRSTTCAAVSGQFWGNVAGPSSPKSNGDRYQASCIGTAAGTDRCTGTVNDDYDENGYFYTLKVDRAVSNLRLEVFDPMLVHVGDRCETNLAAAGSTPAATAALNDFATNESLRYAGGQGPWCTGDIRFGGTGQVSTKFTVRTPSSTPWDPLDGSVVCEQTFGGFNGNLHPALNQRRSNGTLSPTFNETLARQFRQWVPLCSASYVPAGEYTIQVQTNGLGADLASGHNRYSLRAYSSTDTTVRDAVSISGRESMAIYANLPSAQTEFYFARVLPSAAGQVLNLTFFDAGDVSGGATGAITVKAPPDSNVAFSNCKGNGVVDTTLPTCKVTASSAFNGKLQSVSVLIPSNYTCARTSRTGCWVRLLYDYSGTNPADTTSWTAAIEGDPVRLVE